MLRLHFRLMVFVFLALVSGSLHFHMAGHDSHDSIIIVHHDAVPANGDAPHRCLPHSDDVFCRPSGGEISSPEIASGVRRVEKIIGNPRGVTGNIWEPPKPV